MKLMICLLVCGIVLFAPAARAEPPAPSSGASVAYQLPTDGPLPRTYRVTLAIVDAKNPDWIVSQFLNGAVRTVTADNGGKFTETWDGLDDNFMPAPPGTYGVKGIYMPAEKWRVDGAYHTITPRYVGGIGCFLPPPDQATRPEPFGGDPVGAPIGDIAVTPNGVAVFYYSYLENGLNNAMVDLNKPVGYGQFLRAFTSGGAGGGTSVATDGKTVWAFSTDGGPKFVYRADGKSFGSSPGCNRPNSYAPDGWVTAMTCRTDPATGQNTLFIAQRGRFASTRGREVIESETDFANKVTAHDPETGKVLADLPLDRPRGLAISHDLLFALHAEGNGFAVSQAPLKSGLPAGGWQRTFAVPASVDPSCLCIDGHGRFYLSDPHANKVYQLDAAGKITRVFGRLDAQRPGAYDPQSFMSPGKIAAWTDAQGQDRLLVMEVGGPMRVSEWSADGKLIREFQSLATAANDGYAIDPEHPEDFYIPGQQGWLTRFKLDYATGEFRVDAVWPNIGVDPLAAGMKKPICIHAHGDLFLADASGARENCYGVYRLDKSGWKLSAAILRRPNPQRGKPATYFLWHDANGNGRIDPDEMTPTDLPGNFFTAHGQNWGPDLAFLAMNLGGPDIWRLAPESFDEHGNPVFTTWRKIITDPTFAARASGKADAVHGGNELAVSYSSDWYQTDGTPQEGFYVQARAGRAFSANGGAQYKISRYVPDAGEFRQKWRTGRTAMLRVAEEGEFYGAMRIHRPINHLISVVDQSRCGILLFTDEGLFVDSLFPDDRRFLPRDIGLYWQPGEFFVGSVYPNAADGRVYLAMGKDTALVYAADGWNLSSLAVHPLTTLQQAVELDAAHTGTPPEVALSVRGGAGAAHVARFAPAIGGAALDGSMNGWQSCQPIAFQSDKEHTVEVRCLYDPDHLYLRWHARLGSKFTARGLEPIERIFAHDRQADTLSFFIQGDAKAPPSASAEGRPGDARFVFGLFTSGDRVVPAALAMYPQWKGAGAHPQVYRTPVGQAAFAHVGPLEGATLAHAIDDDGKGFVLVAAIPRSAIPDADEPFAGGRKTLVNFSATFAGHNRFWWSNRDGSASAETFDEPTEARLYPGSWSPAQWQDLSGGAVVRDWLICGPFGGPEAENFTFDPNGKLPGTNRDWKQVVRDYCEAASYPPDSGVVDPGAVYSGELLRGYWKDRHEARWKPATIADLDERVILGPSGQVWYGAVWMHAASTTQVDLLLEGHPGTALRWTLNAQRLSPTALQPGDRDFKPNIPAARQTVQLKAGWNQVMFRGYCVGYPPFRAGLRIEAPVQTLWGIGISPTPPRD